MKRLISVAAALAIAWPCLAVAHGGGGGGGGIIHGSGGGGGGGMSHGSWGGASHGPIGGTSGGSISHGSFSSPAGHAPASGAGASHPTGSGTTQVRSVGVTHTTVGAPTSHAMNSTVVHNTAVTHTIAASQRVESIPGHTWVHSDGHGHSFSHFCGHDHTNWWGFWFGASFVWFPYYSGYWWYYDPYYARWDYWYNGYWWWYGPGGATYIYVDNGYVPYDQYLATYYPGQTQYVVTSQQPQPGTQLSQTAQAAQSLTPGAPQDESSQPADASGNAAMPTPPTTAPQTPPASAVKNGPAGIGGTWKTPDGRRMVQISGAAGGAFLFDQTKSPPSLIRHLGDNATRVRFAGGKSGPTKILVDYKDGSFHLYDENGHPAD